MPLSDPIGGLSIPPGTPVLGSPQDGASGVSVTPTFEWDESTSGCTFTLTITDTNGQIIQQINNLSVTTYTLTSPLNYSTQYKWKITAINSDGSTDSVLNSFTTEAVPVPQKVSNIDITYNNNNNAIPTFSWDSVSNAEHYHILITKP